MAGSVAWITIAPVKALGLQSLDSAELSRDGIRGDRRFFLIDDESRLVNGKLIGPLVQVTPAFDEGTRRLELAMPDGSTVGGVVERGAEISASFWKIELDAHEVVGPWSEALSDLAGRRLRLVERDRPAVDRGPAAAASLLSTASLARLAEALGVDRVDGRRFRMQFGIDGVEANAEDAWIDHKVRLGDAVVVPKGNVGRCAVTTQDPDTGVPDLDTLRALGTYRGDVETTEPLPLGIYAFVAEPGTVRLGDPVEPLA